MFRKFKRKLLLIVVYRLLIYMKTRGLATIPWDNYTYGISNPLASGRFRAAGLRNVANSTKSVQSKVSLCTKCKYIEQMSTSIS
jgi:hypothetical protein